MSPSIRFAAIALLPMLLAPAEATASQKDCTDQEANRWLRTCATAIAAVERAELGEPDPWTGFQNCLHARERPLWECDSDVEFVAQSNLVQEFLDACDALVADPARIPEETMVSLGKRGEWPPPRDRCTREQLSRWLAECERDALALPGQIRSELTTHFREEGGLHTAEEQSFYHRRCAGLKVHVKFSLWNPAQRSPDDVIESADAYVGSRVTD